MTRFVAVTLSLSLDTWLKNEAKRFIPPGVLLAAGLTSTSLASMADSNTSCRLHILFVYFVIGFGRGMGGSQTGF